MESGILPAALLPCRVPVNPTPTPSPRSLGWKRCSDVSGRFLQTAAHDGNVNPVVEEVVDEETPTLHHRHPFHQATEALIGDVSRRRRFDER